MPAAVDLAKRRKELGRLPLGHLGLRGRVHRRGKHLYIRARCSACGHEREYAVNNLLSGRTTDCRCQRGLKYGRNPLADIFGHRYDTIRQRVGRRRCGLNRQEFVNYMIKLAGTARPKITTAKRLRQYRIERANQRRGFEIGNLRLVRSPS
jgi:hypothetical protein